MKKSIQYVDGRDVSRHWDCNQCQSNHTHAHSKFPNVVSLVPLSLAIVESPSTQQRQPRRRCQQEQLYALLKSRLSQRCAKLENARWSPLDEGSGNLGTLLGSRVYLEVHASNIPVGKVCTDQRSAPAWLWEVRHVCDETVFHATVQPSRIWFGEVMGPTSFTVLLPTFPIRPYMRALKALVRGKVNLRLMPSASEYTQKSCELLRRTARWGFEKHHGT